MLTHFSWQGCKRWGQCVLALSLASGPLWAAHPAQAQGVSDDPPPNAGVFSSIAQVGTDAVVTFYCPAAGPMNLVLADDLGTEVTTVAVTCAPDTWVEAIVPGGVQDPWAAGWTQQLLLQANGTTLATQAVDVVFVCVEQEASKVCHYDLQLGPNTAPNVVHVSPALAAALDAAGNSTQMALQAHPELYGEVVAYADQTQRVLAHFGPIGPCDCVWTATRVYDPNTAVNKAANVTRGYQKGANGRGAMHWLDIFSDWGGAFAQHVIKDETVSGYTQITLQLRCQRFVGMTHVVWIEFRPDGSMVIKERDVPIYESCLGCAATFNHMGRYAGQTWVNFYTTGNPSEASAEESGTYKVNFGGGWLTLINRSINGNNSFDQTAFANGGAAGNSTTARIDTRGYVRVHSTPLAGLKAGHSASGTVRNSYMLAIHGFAPCAKPQHAATWAYGSYQGLDAALQQNIRLFFAQWGLVVNP